MTERAKSTFREGLGGPQLSGKFGDRPATCESKGCTILPLTGAPYVSSLLALGHGHSLDPSWLQQHPDPGGPTGKGHRAN